MHVSPVTKRRRLVDLQDSDLAELKALYVKVRVRDEYLEALFDEIEKQKKLASAQEFNEKKGGLRRLSMACLWKKIKAWF